MKLWMAKVRRDDKVGLIPTDEAARAMVERLGDGECIEVQLVRYRSVPWNKMYWAMCREIGQNQDPPRDEDSIDTEIRILSGHYDIVYVGQKRAPWWFGGLMQFLEFSGGPGRWFMKRLRPLYQQHAVMLPKRIAFHKMDADEWAEYWKRAEVAITERFGQEYVLEFAA